jgi:hypothetical protein
MTYLLSGIYSGDLKAQTQDSIPNHLYRPSGNMQKDSTDTTGYGLKYRIIQDSIQRIIQFRKDSILARENFIRDSLLHRKQVLDSLNFLKNELQGLLESYFTVISDDIIFRYEKIGILGDSILGDFVYRTLPFGVKDPYVPWKISTHLNGKSVRFTMDEKSRKITAIQLPNIKASLLRSGNMLIIQRKPYIQNNSSGGFYKIPLDSVFFDRSRIARIKSYVMYYSVVNSNQQGAHLFTNKTQVRQFQYGSDGKVSKYELIKFCERTKAYESNKLCSTITYGFTYQGNSCLISRNNNPSNSYSDGTFTFEFDENENLKEISFSNIARTESWKRQVELNKDGNVNCYFDKSNDVIKQSLCMVYHNEPGAKYPVETITTTFEKSGISYFQRNNTTGKIRTRDRMTLEWTPWHAEN